VDILPGGAGGGSRADMLELREVLWRVSGIPDVRKCGRVRCADRLLIRSSPSGPSLSGLCRCHSVWVCPVCAPAIRARRGVQISEAVRSAVERGWSSVFGTATVRHGLGDSLRATYSVVSDAWSAVCRDRGVKAWRAAHAHVGYVRTVEVTYGLAGWHPHIHWLDFWETPLSVSDMRAYESVVWRAWCAAVVRLGGGEPLRGIGIRLLLVEGDSDRLSEYLVKVDPVAAGHELTALDTKAGRSVGLTPFGILRRVAAGDTGVWLARWWEYEDSTRGRRMFASSRDLFLELGVVVDEVLDDGEDGELLGYVTAEEWDALRFSDRLGGAQIALERAAALAGRVGVEAAVRRLLGFAEPVVEVPGSVAVALWG